MAIWMRPPHRVRKRKKSIEAQAVLDKLQAYLDGNTEVPVKMLCGFWKDQQDAITYQEIREAVKAGMLDEAAFQEWARDYSVLVARNLEPVWERAMAAGAASQTLLSGTSFTFNMQAPGVVQWISQRGAAFVTACSEEQKKAVSSLLAQKVVESHTVDELARLIRPCIGLTDGQSKATLRYYDNIAASLRENHPRMKPERIQQKATDAAAKYAERQHRQRAVTIAQTEMAFAYNRGADEGIRQAQAQNLIGAVEKRWSTSGDENVCSTCEALDGVQIGMEGGFGFARRELFEGQDLLPPAHPRCGCAVMYIEVEKSIAPSINVSEDLSMLYHEEQAFIPQEVNGLQQEEPEIRTKEQLEKQGNFMRDIIENITGNKSRWSGTIIVDNALCEQDGCSGKKLWSCDILLKDNVLDGILFHELLHSVSASYYSPRVYVENQIIEECSVEFLTQEIAKKLGMLFDADAYKDDVDILRVLNSGLGLYENDFEFSMALFSQPLPMRFQWLQELVNDSIIKCKEMTMKDAREIMDFVAMLGGWYDG